MRSDLLEPDIPKSGGPIEIRRIAEMASPLTAIASAHICATIPNFLGLEYHSANIPLWHTMLSFKDPI
ncbi:TPA: hypothetical protein DCE37_24090 [Candidatus Latescibacteria bacterium]|nr:hypothetical protein [Candidatus Latescibacterota bacterium]